MRPKLAKNKMETGFPLRSDEGRLRTDDDGDLVAPTAAEKSERVRPVGRPQPLVPAPGILVVDRIQLLLRHGDSRTTGKEPDRGAGGVEQLDERSFPGPHQGFGRRSIDNRLQVNDVGRNLQRLDRHYPGAQPEWLGRSQNLSRLNFKRGGEGPATLHASPRGR